MLKKLVMITMFAILPACCFGSVYDVYIVAGQSNADGRGLKAELTGPLSIYQAVQPNVLLNYTNPGNASGANAYQSGWVSLAPGYSAAPGFNTLLPSPTFGPEVSFGKAMAAATSDRKIAIIKVTRGGTSLHTDWDPTDEPGDPKGYAFAAFEAAVPQALQALKSSGHSVELRGIVWHQGESDTAAGINAYKDNLTQFVETVRGQLGYPDLPFLVGELGRDTSSRDPIRAAQASVAVAMDFVELVTSAGLTQVDQSHFDTASYIAWGHRFADAMLATVSNLPGDFNRDGIVNHKDFEVWQAFEGSTVDARADANNDGIVDNLDLQIWQQAVPEPSSAIIGLSALIALGAVSRRSATGWRQRANKSLG